jgi:hypothetical protein
MATAAVFGAVVVALVEAVVWCCGPVCVDVLAAATVAGTVAVPADVVALALAVCWLPVRVPAPVRVLVEVPFPVLVATVAAACESRATVVSGTGVSPRPLNAAWVSPSVACVAASSSAFVTVGVVAEMGTDWRCGAPAGTAGLPVAVAEPAPATGTPTGP